jgi:hypothetical protein
MVCLAILIQLLTLKFCSMLVPSFLKVETSESNCWHSVFQSVKEVLITSCDFGYMKVCARWVSWGLTVEYKT